MQNIKTLLEEYRAGLWAAHATNEADLEIKESLEAKLAEIHRLMKAEPNKDELVRLWNNNFTGVFNLGGIE